MAKKNRGEEEGEEKKGWEGRKKEFEGGDRVEEKMRRRRKRRGKGGQIEAKG